MGLGAADIITKRVIPVITANAAYSTGFQVGAAAFKIANVANDSPGGCIGYNICILDGNKQDQPFDLIFFDSLPTVTSGDRAAANITLANAKGKIIGAAQVTTYMDLSAISVGFASFTGWAGAPLTGLDIYCLPIVRGTATWTTTTALEFTFGMITGQGR